MKDLRRAFNIAWTRAEGMKGDFQDCLLHQLSVILKMPILNEVRTGYTDGGVVEMGGEVSDSKTPTESKDRGE